MEIANMGYCLLLYAAKAPRIIKMSPMFNKMLYKKCLFMEGVRSPINIPAYQGRTRHAKPVSRL